MQILRMDRKDMSLFCPVTGRPLFDDQGSPSAPSLRGVWRDANPLQPWIGDAELQEHWEIHLELNQEKLDRRVIGSLIGEPDEDDESAKAQIPGLDAHIFLDEFFERVHRSGWLAIDLLRHPIPTDPDLQFLWVVLDVEYQHVEVGPGE